MHNFAQNFAERKSFCNFASQLMNQEYRPYTFDRVVRMVMGVIILVIALYVLNLLKGVLLPFLVACLIAYSLEPLVEINMKVLHVRKRFVPVMLTIMEVTAFVIIGCYLLFPYLVSEFEQMIVLLRKYVAAKDVMLYVPDGVHRYLRRNLSVDFIQGLLTKEQWRELIERTITGTWNVVSTSFSYLLGILSWCIVFLYLIFIMLDYDKLATMGGNLIPERHKETTLAIMRDVKHAMNCYFRGQALIAFIVGCLFAIGFYIIGLPMGIFLGLFIGVLNLVPYLQLISLPITALLCVVNAIGGGGDFWAMFWESMAVYVIVQCIQDLYLTPKIMGKFMGLNPAIILLSLSIWGSLLGFIGLIIALPLTTLLLSYYDRYVVKPYHEKLK